MTSDEKFRELQKLMSDTYKDEGSWVCLVGSIRRQPKDKKLRDRLRKRAKELVDSLDE